MTDQELKDLVASLAIESKETALQMKETDRILQETGQIMKENSLKMNETDRFLKEIGNQIGGLNNKFGSFTEGLVGPSVKRILRERFGCDKTEESVNGYNKEHNVKAEIDFLGYSNNGEKRVVIVEVKSKLKKEHLDQMEKIIEHFHVLFPKYHGYTLEAMFAVVKSFSDIEQMVVASKGFHLAQAADDSFELADPPDFVPRKVQV